jgi:hypothetical protein
MAIQETPEKPWYAPEDAVWDGEYWRLSTFQDTGNN